MDKDFYVLYFLGTLANIISCFGFLYIVRYLNKKS